MEAGSVRSAGCLIERNGQRWVPASGTCVLTCGRGAMSRARRLDQLLSQQVVVRKKASHQLKELLQAGVDDADEQGSRKEVCATHQRHPQLHTIDSSHVPCLHTVAHCA